MCILTDYLGHHVRRRNSCRGTQMLTSRAVLPILARREVEMSDVEHVFLVRRMGRIRAHVRQECLSSKARILETKAGQSGVRPNAARTPYLLVSQPPPLKRQLHLRSTLLALAPLPTKALAEDGVH